MVSLFQNKIKKRRRKKKVVNWYILSSSRQIFTFLIQLFRERLSEKVHATIPKGIVGGFEFTVLQRHMFASAKGKQQKQDRQLQCQEQRIAHIIPFGIVACTFFRQPFLKYLYTYRDLRAKKHRDKNSLFALERPADWSYHFFHYWKTIYRCSDWLCHYFH